MGGGAPNWDAYFSGGTGAAPPAAPAPAPRPAAPSGSMGSLGLRMKQLKAGPITLGDPDYPTGGFETKQQTLQTDTERALKMVEDSMRQFDAQIRPRLGKGKGNLGTGALQGFAYSDANLAHMLGIQPDEATQDWLSGLGALAPLVNQIYQQGRQSNAAFKYQVQPHIPTPPDRGGPLTAVEQLNKVNFHQYYDFLKVARIRLQQAAGRAGARTFQQFPADVVPMPNGSYISPSTGQRYWVHPEGTP